MLYDNQARVHPRRGTPAEDNSREIENGNGCAVVVQYTGEACRSAGDALQIDQWQNFDDVPRIERVRVVSNLKEQIEHLRKTLGSDSDGDLRLDGGCLVQHAGCLIELVHGKCRRAQRLHGLFGGIAQLAQRLADLLRPE